MEIIVVIIDSWKKEERVVAVKKKDDDSICTGNCYCYCCCCCCCCCGCGNLHRLHHLSFPTLSLSLSFSHQLPLLLFFISFFFLGFFLVLLLVWIDEIDLRLIFFLVGPLGKKKCISRLETLVLEFRNTYMCKVRVFSVCNISFGFWK